MSVRFLEWCFFNNENLGLLLARRVLTKLGLAEKYEGCTEPDGERFEVEYDDEGPRPFKAFLDVGLKRTTTGSRLFGALKVITFASSGIDSHTFCFLELISILFAFFLSANDLHTLLSFYLQMICILFAFSLSANDLHTFKYSI